MRLVEARHSAGGEVGKACETLGIARSTHYDWKVRPARPPAPDPAVEFLLGAMRDDVRRLDHVQRRTMGTETIYMVYGAVIPRSAIAEGIRQARREHNRVVWYQALRYEFTVRRLVYAVDFIQVRAGGRVLRVQEENSRCVLAHPYRRHWTEGDAARVVDGVFRTHGVPYALKHDLGPELTSGVFQAVLRTHRVIPLPNPPYWPRANGKLERGNRDTRQWLLPFVDAPLPLEEELREIELALDSHNRIRPREILGWRTPEQVFQAAKPPEIDREKLYGVWQERTERLLRRRTGAGGIIVKPRNEFAAMRLSAMAVLQERGLLRYFKGRGGPEV